MQKLETAFEDLSNLEEIHEKLKQGKQVILRPNPQTIRAVSRGASVVRDRVKAGFRLAKSNREYRRPNASPDALRLRARRDRNGLDIYRQLESYFEEKN